MTLQAFQAAENVPAAKIWGGSNLAAGSDSELGSSLHWTKLRDIAAPIVHAAALANTPTPPVRGVQPARPTVLVAMSAARASELRAILEEYGAEVFTVSSCAEACRALGAGIPIRAILSAQWLPDGGFWDLVTMARRCARFVPVIVCLPEANGGATDLLEAGVSDLIVARYQARDIVRILDSLALCGPVQSPGQGLEA